MNLFPRQIFIALLLTISSLHAAPAKIMVVKSNKANVREGPGTQHKLLWEVVRYMPFEVMGAKGEWMQIKDFEGDKGWVHADLLEQAAGVVVKADTAYVRSGPGKTHKTEWVVKKRYTFQLLDEQDGWYKVKSSEGFEGWIYKNLVWGSAPPAAAVISSKEGPQEEKKPQSSSEAAAGSCASEACFDEKFKKCEPSSFLITVSESVSYRPEIMGLQDNLCRVKIVYTAHENKDWLNKEMFCLLENTKAYKEAENLEKCEGPLFDFIVAAEESTSQQQEEQPQEQSPPPKQNQTNQ